jgi:hypothetical protein
MHKSSISRRGLFRMMNCVFSRVVRKEYKGYQGIPFDFLKRRMIPQRTYRRRELRLWTMVTIRGLVW